MAQPATESEFTLDTAAQLAREEGGGEQIRGRSPWYLAWRRMRRNRVALGALGVFVLIVIVCALAPLYADHVAHTGQNTNHVLDRVKVNGQLESVVSQGGYLNRQGKACGPTDTNCRLIASIPIGPTWLSAGGKFVLGGDANGRDEMVRLLYGGRVSLFVGIVSSAICVFFAIMLSLLAGYFGSWSDFAITRFLRPLLRVPGRAARDRARLGARDQRLPPLRPEHPERQHLDPDARHLVRADSLHR